MLRNLATTRENESVKLTNEQRNLATTRENESVKLTNEQLDRQIIENVLNGDKNAYNLLVVKYQYKVLNVVGKYIYEPADREDIAQQAFIKAYEALPSFRGDSEFYTWLYRIVVNCAKNFLKNKAQNTLTVDVSDPEIESYDGSQKLFRGTQGAAYSGTGCAT